MITHSQTQNIIHNIMSLVKDYDQLVKLILIGSSGVGKSSLLLQFAENKFSQNYLTTIGVDFRFKTLKIDGKSIKFQIWDTAGQDRFRTITSSYYKGADGIIMVYDVSDPKSFQDIEKYWVVEAENYADKNISVILLGNKSDCDRAVPKQKARDYTLSKGYDFEEVSAKTSDKVADTIKNFGKKVAEKKTAASQGPYIQASTGGKEPSNTGPIQINKKIDSTKKKEGCC